MIGSRSVAAVLLRACHPLPAAAVTAISGALALGLGQPVGTAALVAASIGVSQLSVGWANDVIDARRDRAVARTEKPMVIRPDLERVLRVLALIATLATLGAALAWGWPRGFWLALALLSAQLYNWPLKATRLSIVPYLVSFGALPLFASDRPPVWIIVAAALLGGAAHLVNAIPDLADDAATGVRGLPHRLGRRASFGLAFVLLIAATVTLVSGARLPWWAGTIALAMPLLGLFGGARTKFRVLIAVALVDVVLLVVSGGL
ncbi:UbiA family prenyltransferase [Allorhizocola rhizosphaerae]|uniref:UbiA family prenyltransferase n=1 Tax=Allorhizocola rhizosphaerae TaxID=1872709 RepID=UPI000E3D0D4D|nr:UbiA family prenyltransferase [Allorhizocola rhizosphaerae]